MQQDVQDLINEYVAQVESKEADLLALKARIADVVSEAERHMEDVFVGLDAKLDAGTITEEEYLGTVREQKQEIIGKTKERLDALIKNLEAEMNKEASG